VIKPERTGDAKEKLSKGRQNDDRAVEAVETGQAADHALHGARYAILRS
jgi:hypothetical protein